MNINHHLHPDYLNKDKKQSLCILSPYIESISYLGVKKFLCKNEFKVIQLIVTASIISLKNFDKQRTLPYLGPFLDPS